MLQRFLPLDQQQRPRAHTAMSAASPSSSSPRPGSSPISWLPIEVFSRILRHLDTPLDLYKASLVDHKWRAAATDARLWQSHYWAFYRVQLIVNTKEDQLLLDRRTTNRRNAMRAWIERSTNAAPPSPLSPLASLSPSGEIILYEPLEKDLMMIYSMQGFSEDFIETSMRLNEIAIELYGDRGPDDKDKEEAAKRIIAQLVKETGKLPTARDIEYAQLAYARQQEEGTTKITFTEQAPCYPPFLVLSHDNGRKAKPLPDFHALFVRRLNQDDGLLLDLRAHVDRDAEILDDAFTLLLRYGDAAKDLLIALSAGQQLTAQSVAVFGEKSGAVTTDVQWPRALAVHTKASQGLAEPHLSYCVALQYVAQKLLGHLQRREALRSLRQVKKSASLHHCL